MIRLKYYVLLSLLIAVGCKQGKKYHDVEQEKVQIMVTDKVAEIIKFQEELNQEFKNPDESPLPDRYRKDFDGLDFFPPDTNYIIQAQFVRTPEAVPFLMPTTTERQSREVVYGIARFEFKGEEYALEVYQNPELILEEGYKDYLFLPFTDRTNGSETYGGGRYLDLRIPEDDTLTLDFNKAYNPYCAYNKKYSCPLVPSVNRLDIQILAGVKDFKKEH